MIADIVSNEEVKSFFKNELKLKKDSGTYLFYGAGIDMLMEFAIYFAKALACDVIEDDFCDTCSTCKRIDKLIYSDLEILDNPQGIKVDEVRELSYKASASSYEGSKKIFIIKDIGKMKKEALNSMLKMIEEPNTQTFFILLNTNLDILPTIKSRSILVKIKRRNANELGVDVKTYSFFRGNSKEIQEYKREDFDLNSIFSYKDIGSAIKNYDKTKDFKHKVEIYKGIHDFVEKRNSMSNFEKLKFAQDIYISTGDRLIYQEVVSYLIYVLGDLQGLEDRLRAKSMMRFPINMKTFLINLVLDI